MFFILIFILFSNLFTQNIWEERLNLRGTEFDSTPVSLNVKDSNTVYFVTTAGLDLGLYKSIDKGLTWEYLHSFQNFNIRYTRSMSVIDSIILIGFYDGIILKSTNDGKSFNKIDLGYKNFVEDIIMFDDKNGIANMPSRIYKTNDGWKSSYIVTFPFYLNMKNPKKDRNNIINSIIFNFGDDRKSNPIYQFVKINILNEDFDYYDILKMNYDDLVILTDSVFFICGKKNGITGGTGHDAILKSTDAGKTWRIVLDIYTGWANGKVVNNKPFGLQKLAFKNDSVGIAVGQFGKIVYTYDGGESWIYEQRLPGSIDSLNPPTMHIDYAGDKAIIADFSGKIYTLEVDNLAPKPEDKLTISGKIISDDSLAITHIPIRLNSNRITMTDEEGNYKFTKLASGSYKVTALNKYIDSGPKEEYHYEPYLYSPTHSFELTSDTSGVDFESELNIENYFVFGTIFLNDEPIDNYDGLSVKLENVIPGKDTLDATFEINNYSFQGIKSGTYTLRPTSEIYTFEPEFYKLVFNTNHLYKNFIASAISSVKKNNNFEIKKNVLISKEFVGMQYHIFSLTGRVVKNGTLTKELNLNVEQIGTYILHITKGEQVIYSHKFQVVR